MSVDHSRQDQLAAEVNDLPRHRRQDVLADERDLAVGDGDIHDAVDAGGRADDVTVLQDEIVDRGCVHDWLPWLNSNSTLENEHTERLRKKGAPVAPQRPRSAGVSPASSQVRAGRPHSEG